MHAYTVTITQMKAAAEELLRYLRSHPREGACVVGLSGDLGAGKTSLTQAIAEILGIHTEVTSPTFVIAKTYRVDDVDFDTLIHIDAYRIEDIRELEVLGFTEMCRDRRTLICIEWPERIGPLLPKDMLSVAIEHIDPNTRRISYA